MGNLTIIDFLHRFTQFNSPEAVGNLRTDTKETG